MALRIKPEKREEKERISLALLRATLQLAAAHGFASLGLREVSRAAEIAPTSFYRHFTDMEALGMTLIQDLVRKFVRDWVEPAPASAGAVGVVESIADRALAGAAADPELMRFILAERVGAISSFRAALAAELNAVSTALHDAFAADVSDPELLEEAAGAATALVLEACTESLDRAPDEVPAVRERLIRRIRMLICGASAKGATP